MDYQKARDLVEPAAKSVLKNERKKLDFDRERSVAEGYAYNDKNKYTVLAQHILEQVAAKVGAKADFVELPATFPSSALFDGDLEMLLDDLTKRVGKALP